MDRMSVLLLAGPRRDVVAELEVHAVAVLLKPWVPKTTPEDGLKAFLVAFEWWSTQLGPNLIGYTQAAYWTMTHEAALYYDAVKTAILQCLNNTEEAYRHRFQEYQRPVGVRSRVVAQQLAHQMIQWARADIRTAAEVAELFTIEQLAEVSEDPRLA
ncbi:hypothetical protein EOD39_4202 [Acipenser ruthenus]|uniref:Uncharacterized protein n=1 Tax=Acipenser ruthenus TaxID=7906 RepID=A0A444UJF4_ACIRT|nr:hypothetical protein EOD39_4202 [Acipenser ruthenus]